MPSLAKVSPRPRPATTSATRGTLGRAVALTFARLSLSPPDIPALHVTPVIPRSGMEPGRRPLAETRPQDDDLAKVIRFGAAWVAVHGTLDDGPSTSQPTFARKDARDAIPCEGFTGPWACHHLRHQGHPRPCGSADLRKVAVRRFRRSRKRGRHAIGTGGRYGSERVEGFGRIRWPAWAR